MVSMDYGLNDVKNIQMFKTVEQTENLLGCMLNTPYISQRKMTKLKVDVSSSGAVGQREGKDTRDPNTVQEQSCEVYLSCFHLRKLSSGSIYW